MKTPRRPWMSLLALTLTLCLAPLLGPAAPGARGAEPASHRVYLPLVQGRQDGPPPPVSIIVDPALAAPAPSLPALADGVARPLAVVADPHGNLATFVADELLVQTDDRAELDALLARTGGVVLLTIDPAASGVPGLPITYLVRVDSRLGDVSRLAADLEALGDTDARASGAHRISSQAGAGLLAIAAAEARSGGPVGVNWVGATDGIPGSTGESPAGPEVGGVPYSPDAYQWPYMSRGSTQDIGVAAAWSALAHAGRLGNRPALAILDKGFAAAADTPSDTSFGSVVPGVGDPRGVRGDGGSPWHGTHVLATALGMADNGAGAAGVAPMARPIAIYTGYDYVLSIAAVIMARAQGARVINMSYGAYVPAAFAWTVLPFEATTAAVRASGALLFAAAGNDGIDTDAQDCFIGICWEETMNTPCENAGVICVGGLGWNARSRAGNSNYGSASGVQIFAPYNVYAGADPDNAGGDSNLRLIAGTSFSSPFVAGVAALVWAADPALSAEQVWAIMRDTAHTPGTPNVPRYVNAYGAVLRALGSDVSARIISPVAGRTYEQGGDVPLSAELRYAASRPGVPVVVQWRTAAGRVLREQTLTPPAGERTLFADASVRDLPAGEQMVIVRATAGLAVSESQVVFRVRNTPPTVTIGRPLDGASFCYGAPVNLRGSAFDPNQPTGLPATAFAWSSSRDGALGAGTSLVHSGLSVGSHSLHLRVTDGGGLVGEASVGVRVLGASDPACFDMPPTAQITAPADNSGDYPGTSDDRGTYLEVELVGHVGDIETAAGALTVGWSSDVEGYLGASAAAADGTVRLTARLHVRPGDASTGGTVHIITLRVRDAYGNVTTDQIRVGVYVLF